MTDQVCALCGESRNCLETEIDSMLYDICPACWSPLAEKLQGKGRRAQESVTVAPPVTPAGDQDEKPFPGKPSKVWLSASSK